MRLVFCFSGKTNKGPVRDIVDDYKKRISRYKSVDIIEAKSLRLQQRSGIHVILSPEGEYMDSKAFAGFINQYLMQGIKHLFFYTGGPTGLPEEIVTHADKTVSLSKMTFNHQLIRAMLFEQVYRGFTIINNEPYHK